MTPLDAIEIDPSHSKINPFDQELIRDVWQSKYAWQNEKAIEDTFWRVAEAVYINDSSTQAKHIAYNMMVVGLWMPGGRILAGAGTSKQVTLMNCYVNGTLEDSMKGIHTSLGNVMFTLQQGGGIGTDFTPLRPSGALLQRTGPGSAASGPIPFMHTWDAVSKTIKSAGDRRGAMMATMSDTHPDLPQFIKAKQEAGALEQFNISVLVSDLFMQAIESDDIWLLYSHHRPAKMRSADLEAQDFEDNDGVHQYVYSTWNARELWDKIITSTYNYSEPGVIFIDRINALNNLSYCEEIRCTNPCVTGDTPILTIQGYIPIEKLVGKSTSVWNGKIWSWVKPFSTGVQPLILLEFSNGMQLRVTPQHKFFTSVGIVEASELLVGTKLRWNAMPIINLPGTLSESSYSTGFYCGDGCIGSNHSKVYSPKYCCTNRLEGTFSSERIDRGTYINWYHGSMPSKDYVPVNEDLLNCIDWLAGLLDADGCIESKGKSYVLTLSSKNKLFLQAVVLMLTRLGCNPRMWDRQDGGRKIVKGVAGNFSTTFNLMINARDVWNLKTLGLECERLNLDILHEPKGIARVGQRVTKIEVLNYSEETFCFTEPYENAGIFNAILGHNCGEQPLPPDGACNLGAVNLARLVSKPFQKGASLNIDLLKAITSVGTRFLDNVLDITKYPLPAQKLEGLNKRRLGLGISGLADCLAQLGHRYGSRDAIVATENIMSIIANTSYETSARLAAARGTFPCYNEEAYLNSAFVKRLTKPCQKFVLDKGLRNGVLLTIAPTGTTSLIYGNVSSGLEPVFLHVSSRKIFQKNNTWKEYGIVPGYNYRLYQEVCGPTAVEDLPDYMATAANLSVDDHLHTQAACQKWVDSSVSKTINLPEDITFENFQEVYTKAYALGCKGCTTYKPSDIRGSILSAPKDKEASGLETIPSRPECLQGSTYKVKWPSWSSSVYITINHDTLGKPFEVFIQSKDARHQEWITALTIMISAIMRRGGDVRFIPGEFQQIHSTHDSAWIGGKFYGSLVSRIGDILEQHFKSIGLIEDVGAAQDLKILPAETRGTICPSCGAPALMSEEGCKKCRSCGYTNCG